MAETTPIKNSFLKSTILLAGAMIVSQLIGLLSKSLIGASFGASAEVDAFLASNRLTETIFNLVAGGALASAFVPTFSAMLDQDNKQSAWHLASHIANLLIVVLVLLCGIGFIFAPQIVRYILVPGFALNDPVLQSLTIQLLRIQLPSVVIFGISGLLMGILNTNQEFFIPGLAPAMYQVGILVGVLFLRHPLGIKGLAVGAVLGSLFHFAVQLPRLLRIHGKSYTRTLGLKEPAVREIIRLMIPRQIGASAVQLNFLINNFLASFLPSGSISAITWGLAIMLMPQAAIAQSVATVSLPLFSVQAARGELDKMRNALAATIRLVIILALPASCGLILLGTPIVRLIFERRAFNPEMTSMVTWALMWYSAGLIFHCVVEVLSRAFYAIHDTKTPVIVLFFAMALNMALSYGFSLLFHQIGWMPHGGLALANTIATGLEMATLLLIMRRKINGLNGKHIMTGIAQSALATIMMGIGLVIVRHALMHQSSLILTAAGISAGGAIYATMCFLLKIEETAYISRLLHRK